MAMTEDERAALSQRRGKLAAGIKDPEERRKFVSAQGDEEAKKSGDAGELRVQGSTSNEENKQALGDILGSRKKGGPIKKTGLYQLHKGEHVLTKPQTKVFLHHAKKK